MYTPNKSIIDNDKIKLFTELKNSSRRKVRQEKMSLNEEATRIKLMR